MGPIPRRESAVVPLYSALTPRSEVLPAESSPDAQVEMTYRVVKRLLGALSFVDQSLCLRRLADELPIDLDEKGAG